MTREKRADVHYDDRVRWLVVNIRKTGRQAFGIPSLSKADLYHLCDGEVCTCPDFRFHGLATHRIGQGGSHLPCSHILAVQRVLREAQAQAAIAESQRYLSLKVVNENEVALDANAGPERDDDDGLHEAERDPAERDVHRDLYPGGVS